MKPDSLNHTLLLLLILSFFTTYFCEEVCDRATCHECIQQLGCSWCTEPNLTIITDGSNCVNASKMAKHGSTWCSGKINDPKSEMPKIIEDKDFNSEEKNQVQLKPQKISLKLRRGEEQKIQFQYQQAENYPVDLYYLMDLSVSMEPHKHTLSELGEQLGSALGNLTKQYQLGFGSFVDKVALPFVDTSPASLKSPCIDNKCVPPYLFKHHLKLVNDAKKFTKKVRETQVSGNVDTPEGGLDAAMQAIVCTKEIGWREKARRLLVISTDADYHMAGDGKLAGVLEPNDGKCHLIQDNTEMSYPREQHLKYDYPSVSHLSYMAEQYLVYILFAIPKSKTEEVEKVYKELSENIKNSHFAVLKNNSNNVVEIIKKIYTDITNEVKMTYEGPSNLNVEITSNCTNSKNSGLCKNVKVGERLHFNAKITATDCNKPNQSKIIKIRANVNETIEITVEVDCQCECEKEKASLNDTYCSNNGDLRCGICECHNKFVGKHCECYYTSDFINTKESNCIDPNSQSTCNNKGSCKCNTCVCEDQYYGKYCDCNDYSCPKINEEFCSGHGTCQCGKCICSEGYEGDHQGSNYCQCPISDAQCRKDDKSAICSDHGKCVCGECQCTRDENRYSGKYCEECNKCEAQLCEELNDCVECKVFKTGKLKDTCDANCTIFPNVVDKFKNETDTKKCSIFRDECRILYEYHYMNNKTSVTVLKEKVCNEPPNVIAWVSGVIVAIVLIGVVTLIIWKILTTIHDKREYAKFVDETQNMIWHNNTNPLFKSPTTEIRNPLYNRNSSVKFSK